MRWRVVRCHRCGRKVGEVLDVLHPDSGPVARFRCLPKAGGCGAWTASPWPVGYGKGEGLTEPETSPEDGPPHRT